MKSATTKTPEQLWREDVATAKAVRQTADTFGTRAVVFGCISYFEGPIVHVGASAVVVASGGKFYVARRVYVDGLTRLDLQHTTGSLDGAIAYAGRCARAA